MAGSNYSYENEFYTWLSERTSSTQLSGIYEAFASLNEYCLQRKILARPLFETDDMKALKAVQQTIDQNRIFKFTHRRHLSKMTTGIRQYKEFLKTREEEKPAMTVPVEAVDPPQEELPAPTDPLIGLILNAQIEFIDHRDKGGALWILGAEKLRPFVDWDKRQNGYLMDALRLFRSNLLSQEQSVDESDKNEQPASPASDSEVAELLSDSLFDPLRRVLVEERIYTIEDLKKVKLWPFMNQHDLYTIATRQVVLAKAQELLTPPKQVNNSLLWHLHCGEAVYEGETASIAFLKYCESMARKFPLKIRTLLGKNVPGSTLVALHRTSTQGDPLRMENPTAFIQEDLTADEVFLLTTWLGNALDCSSDDVRIEEPTSTPVVPETLPPEQREDIPQFQELCIPGFSTGEDAPSAPSHEDDLSDTDRLMIQRIESMVLQADMTGLTFDELRDALHETIAATRRSVAHAKRIVEIKERLYHEDALIDWTEGVDRLETIMDKLMQKNNGYISAVQLAAI